MRLSIIKNFKTVHLHYAPKSPKPHIQSTFILQGVLEAFRPDRPFIGLKKADLAESSPGELRLIDCVVLKTLEHSQLSSEVPLMLRLSSLPRYVYYVTTGTVTFGKFCRI